MSKAAGAPSRVYVDAIDLSGLSNSFEMNVDVNLPEITTFDDTGDTNVESKYGAQVTINGFMDADDDANDETMWATLGANTQHKLGLYPGSAATYGSFGYELLARPKNQVRPVDVKAALLLNMTFLTDSAIVRSTVLANKAITGSGVVANSAQQTGATSAGERLVMVIRCIAFTGTNLTVDLEQSSDNAVGDPYALITAMQQAITAVGSWRLTTILATEAWKRINITAFTGTSMTLLIAIGKEQGVS